MKGGNQDGRSATPVLEPKHSNKAVVESLKQYYHYNLPIH